MCKVPCINDVGLSKDPSDQAGKRISDHQIGWAIVTEISLSEIGGDVEVKQAFIRLQRTAGICI